MIVRLAIGRRILSVQRELEASIARLDAVARTDPLTGLSNRRNLDDVLGAALSQATCVKPCSVVAVDVDHFKSYNDSFGHGAGDEVLRVVGTLLRLDPRRPGVSRRGRGVPRRVAGDDVGQAHRPNGCVLHSGPCLARAARDGKLRRRDDIRAGAASEQVGCAGGGRPRPVSLQAVRARPGDSNAVHRGPDDCSVFGLLEWPMHVGTIGIASGPTVADSTGTEPARSRGQLVLHRLTEDSGPVDFDRDGRSWRRAGRGRRCETWRT